MTAHDVHPPTTATNLAAAPTTPVTHANHDDDRDTVPIIVWRISPDEPDAASGTEGGNSPLTSRLAQYLVAIYSDVHGTVVDCDADDNLRRAAEANGRRYLTVDSPTDLTAQTDRSATAALILLRWPRPAAATSSQDAISVLSACQQHLNADGSIIVIVRAAALGNAGPTYSEHEQILLQAAQATDLRHLHDIVPLDATDDRDTFTYATGHDNDTLSQRQTTLTTLMIFAHPETVPVTPGDSRDRCPDAMCQHHLGRPVPRDTTAQASDRHLTPHDRADKPTHPADDSSYGACASPGTDDFTEHDLNPERTSDPCQPSSHPDWRLQRSAATGHNTPLSLSGTSESAVRP
jgi:hypothetical protein